MAVVKMAKIKLIGLSEEKEKILNALHKTGCVQLKETSEMEETVALCDQSNKEAISDKYLRLKNNLEFLTEYLIRFNDKEYQSKEDDGIKNFFVSYNEFMAIKEFEPKADELLSSLDEYRNNLNTIKSERLKLANLKAQLNPYSKIEMKFSDFKDTDKASVNLGLIKAENTQKLLEALGGKELCVAKVLQEGADNVVAVICFNSIRQEIDQILLDNGFNKCAFNYDCSPKEKINEIDNNLLGLDQREEQIKRAICSYYENLRNLKILCDYYKFSLEKEISAEKFRNTETTFILEGYLPEERAESVKEEINGISEAIFFEFSQPTKEDNPPTLLKNNKIIRQSEFIIDLYSAPDYRESDPTKITFFFFMLFMGVIMADIGYGIIMIALGLTLALRIKVDNGARRLWNVIAIGGVSTIIFGLLFNSFFGFSLPFYSAILPSPVPNGTGTDSLMTIMLLCLALGIFQIAVGYLWKAINCFKQGDIAGGIFDGLIWVLFFIGFVFAAFNFLIGYLMPDALEYMDQGVKGFFDTMTTPGLIIVGVALVTAMLTAGRKEKGFGHFTKGFGALYGIINIMSDILSYARLFGLMLSGMIIAQTFNDMGVSMLNGGGVGYALGPLVLVVGHVFNLAMGVLGAYIHDSRLQYIEFFGKFYTGEGDKFTPIGSKMDYIYLTK